MIDPKLADDFVPKLISTRGKTWLGYVLLLAVLGAYLWYVL